MGSPSTGATLTKQTPSPETLVSGHRGAAGEAAQPRVGRGPGPGDGG